MDRRTRTIVVLAIAIAMAGIASYSVYRLIQRLPIRQVEVAHQYTVVAAEPLAIGTRLARHQVRLVPWPTNSPVAGGFSKIDSVVNRGLVADVAENEPLTEGKLAPVAAGAGLPPTISPGMRAMSVRVNDVIGVAGFVVPGTRVDVLVTVRGQAGGLSRVVVSNVRVLTAGTRYDQEKAKEGQPMPSTVVTLLVTPEDAERIALAESEGQLMLTLRNPMDTAPTETKGIRSAALMGEPAPPPVERVVEGRKMVVAQRAAPPPPAAPVKQVYTVEAIRAAKRTEEVVR